VVRRRRPSPRKERSPLHIRQVMIGSSDILRAHRMSLTGQKQDWRCCPPPRASRRYLVATGLLAIPPLQHPLHSSQSPGCQQLLLLPLKRSPAIFTHCCARRPAGCPGTKRWREVGRGGCRSGQRWALTEAISVITIASVRRDFKG